MKKERIGGGVGMGLNLLLLLAMVAANILSFYHLSSTRTLSPSSLPNPNPNNLQVPDHLLHQLTTIRATITHLTRLQHSSSSSSSPSSSSPPSDLLLFSHLSPIASACSAYPDLLHRFMNYTPFTPCPADLLSLAEPLILRGCHPLPRRRCFSPTPKAPTFRLPTTKDPTFDSPTLLSSKSPLDLTIPQLLSISRRLSVPIALALDVAGGPAALAAHLKAAANATTLTTTMDLGAANSEAAARRGAVPVHAPLQQRFPVADGAMDLVRTGHAVNRWIPAAAMEFLIFDVDRVLKGGGFFWVDHFFCRGGDLERVYVPMIGRLGYKRIKWAVGNKTDAKGVKYGEVYLTALLQKPPAPAPATATAGGGKV